LAFIIRIYHESRSSECQIDISDSFAALQMHKPHHP